MNKKIGLEVEVKVKLNEEVLCVGHREITANVTANENNLYLSIYNYLYLYLSTYLSIYVFK